MKLTAHDSWNTTGFKSNRKEEALERGQNTEGSMSTIILIENQSFIFVIGYVDVYLVSLI